MSSNADANSHSCSPLLTLRIIATTVIATLTGNIRGSAVSSSHQPLCNIYGCWPSHRSQC
eukprot:18538-Heterococcus_DN1.PRE.3